LLGKRFESHSRGQPWQGEGGEELEADHHHLLEDHEEGLEDQGQGWKDRVAQLEEHGGMGWMEPQEDHEVDLRLEDREAQDLEHQGDRAEGRGMVPREVPGEDQEDHEEGQQVGDSMVHQEDHVDPRLVDREGQDLEHQEDRAEGQRRLVDWREALGDHGEEHLEGHVEDQLQEDQRQAGLLGALH
jgi:hypothetical protein